MEKSSNLGYIQVFDNILFTPNGKVHRLITRLAFDKMLHPFQPFILGQKEFTSKIAIQNNIELIFYGENQAEYGNNKEDSRVKYGLNFFLRKKMMIFISVEVRWMNFMTV